ncbi:hypothetical protein [Paenibacillus terrae]|uniref:Uncharacterized protein n=1 Tax=Paenibacillus terrae TaxID=159743 RepID=A0A0D7WUN2_9BACL|nr:hypothetical protein [Paenibacillus terrae]KJD42423.1 hypothetical protein QD47_28355 [Paenibacillus terrae]
MKKGLKWTLWVVLLLILGGIFLNFYLNYFTFAYALMSVLLLVFSGWGALAKLKNDVHEYKNQLRRESDIDDIERYTR